MTKTNQSKLFSRVVPVFVLWVLFCVTSQIVDAETQRHFAGSVQLDYMAVPTTSVARNQSLDGATVELSLKLAIDFSDDVSSSVKICVACHGLEVGMAYFNVHVNDRLNVRVGRFSPSFGDFPLRHDPANHRTSDKPLPYDMGRMLRLREWNMGVLPAPWVDNGIELTGTEYLGSNAQVDYAVYAVGGPRGPREANDFDYILSRSRNAYYVDNNSRPSVGGRIATTFNGGESITASLGASGMYGTYDPDNKLEYWLGGVDLVVQLRRAILRFEYLARRTEVHIGSDPAEQFRYGPDENGVFDKFVLKEGFYTEAEVPFGKFDFVARWDGLRRRGNVLKTSPLRKDSAILRYTGALTYKLGHGLRLKMSGEFYDFSDFQDEIVIHTGIAGPF